MNIRKAVEEDIKAVALLYEHVLEEQEQGRYFVGWLKGVYPVEDTARQALKRDDLFVMEDEQERIVGTAIINQIQLDSYKDRKWRYDVPESEVMVLHTLVVDPAQNGKGYGKAFVRFYEAYALEHGCRYLRMDTQMKNMNARALYEKLGYTIVDTVPCVFNGIPDVELALIEKKL